MKRLTLGISILVVFLSTSKAIGQTWCIRIGGPSSDIGYSIIQTSDGGYLIAGNTSSFGAGQSDIYLVKISSIGDVEWTRTIGGPNNDHAQSIIQATDGGYAIVGWTNSFGAGAQDVYVVKVDQTGTVQWTRTIGGSNDDNGYSIIQTSDGGYAIAGHTLSYGAGSWDVYVIKLNSTGGLEWRRVVGGSSGDLGYSIAQTSDGGYTVVGYTSSFAGNYDKVYVIKLDASGNVQWTSVIYDDALSCCTWVFSMTKTSDGGFALTGANSTFSNGFDGSYDVYFLKTDGSFSTIGIVRDIGGSAKDEIGYSIIQTSDGGYAIAGYTYSFGGGGQNVYVVKLNSTGNIQWTRTLGPGIANSIIQTTDGGYAIVGTQGNDVYFVKLDANGNVCPSCNPNSGGSVVTGVPLQQNVSSNSNIGGIVGGPSPTTSAGGTRTIICMSAVDIIENDFDESTSICYSNSKVKISFGKVYNNVLIIVRDVSGKEVMRKEVSNTDKAELDIKGKSGIYFIELKNKDKRAIFKIMKG